MTNRPPSDHELRRRALELLHNDDPEHRFLRRAIIFTALAVVFLVGLELIDFALQSRHLDHHHSQ